MMHIHTEAKREAAREKEREKARAKREASTEHELVMSPQGKAVRIKKEWLDPVSPGVRKSSRLIGFGTVATPDGQYLFMTLYIHHLLSKYFRLTWC